MLEGPVRLSVVARGVLQAILAKCLAHQAVAIVEHIAMVVLVGTVDAIGPHVLVVAMEERSRGVVPEIEHGRHTLAQPVARSFL